jgi:anti-anti-sigma factor
MKIDRDRVGEAVVLMPRGRIDTAAAADFERAALEAVRGEAKLCVIDLGEVDYITSAGLRVVLMAAKESRARRNEYALCGLRPEVLKLFETTGLARILRIVPDRAAALFPG